MKFMNEKLKKFVDVKNLCADSFLARKQTYKGRPPVVDITGTIGLKKLGRNVPGGAGRVGGVHITICNFTRKII